jgi:hypothetical protein
MNGLYGGMYYFRARFLDTGLSRFVSRDSAGFQGGGHLYDYGGNAPADFNDPTGKCDVPGAFVGAALGVAGAVGTGGIKGNVPGIVVGGLVGAVVGCFDPFASEEAGSWSASGVSALSNFLASAAGQAAGNYFAGRKLYEIDPFVTAGAVVGGVAGAEAGPIEEATGGVIGTWLGLMTSQVYWPIGAPTAPPEAPARLSIQVPTLGDFSGITIGGAWALLSVDIVPAAPDSGHY